MSSEARASRLVLINGSVAGGFPPWLTNIPDVARRNTTGYKDAWTPYIAQTAKFAAPFQYPDGPIIAVQVENEMFSTAPDNAAYMQQIEDTMRANGITKVPLYVVGIDLCSVNDSTRYSFHNDIFPGGNWIHGTGAVDL